MADAYLEVRRSDGAELVRLAGSRVTLGREPANMVAFPEDGSVSRSHAVLERVAEGWLLRDLGSSNGTYVNGARLDGDRILQAGDSIFVGHSELRFEEGEAATATLEAAKSAAAGGGGGYLDLSEEWRASPDPGPAPPPRERVTSAGTDAVRPAPDPARGAASSFVARSHGRSTVRGVARGIQVRKTENDRSILAFRVDRYDASGDRLAPVAVELADHAGGQINEGEEVEVSGKWSRGTLKARRVLNLTTNAEVHGPGLAQRVVVAILVLIVLGFFAFVVVSIITAPSVENPFE